MKQIFISLFALLSLPALADRIFIPMDSTQSNHIKAYGASYEALRQHLPVQWLLNYRGGSYLASYSDALSHWLSTRNVTFKQMSESESAQLLLDMKLVSGTSAVTMEQAPVIGVYAPSWNIPVDDAVVIALHEAEIPYTAIYDDEVLHTDLKRFDFIHLHHEDFTGQYGKFWSGYRNTSWYINEKQQLEAIASKNGYAKVSQLKLAVAQKLKSWIADGGHLFAMCSATDSYDIALAAEGLDICDSVTDGDAFDAAASQKLDYSKCLAFQNFQVYSLKNRYEFSDIDTYETRTWKGKLKENNDAFTLGVYDASQNPELAMLVQNHQLRVKGFWGMTSGFNRRFLKPETQSLATGAYAEEANYIAGSFDKGSWTFLSGHDPEDYQHRLEDPATDLSKYPNSAGYRLILNNVMRSSVAAHPAAAYLECSVYPNPVINGQASLQIRLSETEPVVVSIYNISGALVSEQQLGEQTGEISHAVSVSELPAGVYEIAVKAGTRMQRLKLVVQ